MSTINHTDVAVVGAGIVGLAHALAAARRGLKVVVFERNSQAVGASIRNFGMVWPIGQPIGSLLNRALRSREIWVEVASKAGFPVDQCGSIHLAYRQDEMDVLQEFVDTRRDGKYSVALLSPDRVAEKSSAAVMEGLIGGLWSATEAIVDPREAIAKIPQFLMEEYDVEFQFQTVVTDISHPNFVAGGEEWTCDRLYVCSGSDFETLYPTIYQKSGITKVKLQMLRSVSQPNNWQLGPALCAGLTLTHYTAFAHCPSLATLKARIQSETPYFVEWGIHVMVSQNALGELTIGDTHEYGLNPDPFDRTDLNDYVLDYFKHFAQPPSLQIAQTWHGIYAKIPSQTELIVEPEPGVTIVNALSGAGMTLSFGLAEEVMAMA